MITLTDEETQLLRQRARKYTLPYFQVLRAQMIILAAEGIPNDEIAARLNTRREVVSQWRKRFFYERLPGLEERSRPGRPGLSPPEVMVQVKTLACELPISRGLPLTHMSVAAVGREVPHWLLLMSVGTIKELHHAATSVYGENTFALPRVDGLPRSYEWREAAWERHYRFESFDVEVSGTGSLMTMDK